MRRDSSWNHPCVPNLVGLYSDAQRWRHPIVPMIYGLDAYVGGLGRSPIPGGSSELYDWGGTSRYTMEILRPKSSGLDANDRIYAAYPGLEYNIGAAVIGGVPPFKYELYQNVPDGMSINKNTGIITWTNPQSNATNVGLRVTDTKGTVVESQWSITVSSSRFKFIAPASSGGSDSNTGTEASPWATLNKFKQSGGVTGIGVFRTGTYGTLSTGLVDQGEGIRWGTTASSPSIFTAYPGESPEIDFEGSQFDFGDGGPTPRGYIDGFNLFGGGNKTLRGYTNNNFVVRRCSIGEWGPGTDGSNSGFWMQEHSQGTNPENYSNQVFQDLTFNGPMTMTVGNGANCMFKCYGMRHTLFERITISALVGSDGGDENEALFSNKAGNEEMTARYITTLGTCVMPVFGGSQHAITAGPCDWQVHFCNIAGPNSAVGVIKINEFDNVTSPHFYERNTIRTGWVYVKSGATGQGPWHFHSNVVVNENTGAPAGTHVQHGTPTDLSLDIYTNHTAGFAADGIVDSNGLLQGQYRTDHLYRRGHEIPTLS